MTRVLLIGATGRLGTYLAAQLRYRADFEVLCQSRHPGEPGWVKFDTADGRDVFSALDRILPDVIINAAALTDVDYCQRNPLEAYVANTVTVQHIAQWVLERHSKAYLMQISTDHVYGGTGYQPEDAVRILNHYAYTKYCAEYHVAMCRYHINIRTNFFGNLWGLGKKSYSDWIIEQLRANVPVALPRDCMFNPVSIGFLRDFLLRCIEEPLVGTFNLGSRSGLSKYEFGSRLADFLDVPRDLLVETSALSSQAPVPRPLDMRMAVGKLEAAIGPVPRLLDMIKEVAHERSDTRP